MKDVSGLSGGREKSSYSGASALLVEGPLSKLTPPYFWDRQSEGLIGLREAPGKILEALEEVRDMGTRQGAR